MRRERATGRNEKEGKKKEKKRKEKKRHDLNIPTNMNAQIKWCFYLIFFLSFELLCIIKDSCGP